MSLRLRDLQVDVPSDDHDSAVAWWSAALGGTPREVDGVFTYLDRVRSRVGVHVQRLGPGGTAGYHLDLAADDPDAEVAPLERLGATVVDHDGWTVLTDPAGLAFCVTAGEDGEVLDDDRTRQVHLRVLMLDVPAVVADAEADFWAAALGGEARPVGERFPAYTWINGVQGPGGDVDLAVQAVDAGGPRLHVDLHCPDPTARDAEVARLTGLGAREVGAAHHWRILATPGGPLACVVPDRAT